MYKLTNKDTATVSVEVSFNSPTNIYICQHFLCVYAFFVCVDLLIYFFSVFYFTGLQTDRCITRQVDNQRQNLL